MNDILLKLDKVRERDKDVKIAGSVLASILILVFGIVIGAIALTIQHFAANSTVWWQDIFKDVAVDQIFKHFPVWFMFGLGVAINSSRPIKAAINDFLFFIGVIAGYNLVPMILKDVAKPDNMGTWFLIAIVSIPLAMIFWYAKSQSWPSIAFDAVILGVLGAICFDCGFLYFHFSDADMIMDLYNAIIVALVAVLLASGVVQFVVSLAVGVLIALLLGPVL